MSAFPDRYDQVESTARRLLSDVSPTSFADGSFVKSDSSATVYRMAGGTPVPISSMSLVGNSPIPVVSAVTLNSLLARNPYPKDGTFVKSASNATVYRMAGGTPVPISSMSLVGSSYIVSLNDSSINWLTNRNPYPKDGTFVKSASNATVYRMAGGTPVPISSMSLVGSSYIVSLNDSSINWLTNRNPYPKDGTFVKSASNATVYRMAGGTPVPISSMSLVGSSYIVSLNDSSINWLTNRNPYPKDGTFVKSASNATVYRMAGGTPVPISSMSLVGSSYIVSLNDSSINWLTNRVLIPRMERL